MTMPKKLWIAPWWWETKLQNAVRRKNEDMEDDVLYIRSDIAEDLARALGAALSGEMQNSPDTWAHAEDALTRFRAITH